MPKDVSSLQVALNERPPHPTLTRWLYQELRRAILDRRLPPGMRLPATRDLAIQHCDLKAVGMIVWQGGNRSDCASHRT
jgi:Bacterial regulatory proteins, gntR family